MHLEDEQIQRLLHGELDGPAKAALRGHVETCSDCRARLDEAEREEERIFGLLRHVDHALPAADVGALVARASGLPIRWGRWAAGILLMLGVAGAAYAAPGSPLPTWADRLTRWIAGPSRGPDPAIGTPTTEPGAAGIAVEPGERLTIVFETPQAQGVAAVALTEGRSVVVRRMNGQATFTTESDRLIIAHRDSTAVYEIEVPHTAAWVEIRAGDRRLLLKQASRVTTDGPLDGRGRYLLALTRQQ